MSFRQLCVAATIVTSERDPLHLVHEWNAKRETLELQVMDLPFLVSEYKKRRKERHPTKANVEFIDDVPSRRLANACESTCHGVYAMAEVAAGFANRISKGALPATFNSIRKKVRAGETDAELAAALADLEWYEKVRELRTEWTHYSSVFIGEAGQGEPLFVVRSYRRQSDKEHFKTESQHSVSEIMRWTLNAIKLLDGFGSYLLKKYVLPSLDLEAGVYTMKRDDDGTPVFLEDGRFEGETLKVRDYLTKYGVDVRSLR